MLESGATGFTALCTAWPDEIKSSSVRTAPALCRFETDGLQTFPVPVIRKVGRFSSKTVETAVASRFPDAWFGDNLRPDATHGVPTVPSRNSAYSSMDSQLLSFRIEYAL